MGSSREKEGEVRVTSEKERWHVSAIALMWALMTVVMDEAGV